MPRSNLLRELSMLSSVPLADRDNRERKASSPPPEPKAAASPKPQEATPNALPRERGVRLDSIFRGRAGGVPALNECESSSSDEEEEEEEEEQEPQQQQYDNIDELSSDDDSEVELLFGNDDDDGSDDEDENKENRFECPPIPEGNGKNSFTAIDPVNVLLPLDLLENAFTNLMICPCVGCPSKQPNNNNHTLEVVHQQYGFATETCVQCSACGWGTAVCPLDNQTKGDAPNSTPVDREEKKKKKKFSQRDSENFHKYEINYSACFLMQKLGLGLRGLDLAFAFLGIAPNHGSNTKWNRILNRIGLAEQTISDEVMEENRAKELEMTIQKAEEYMEAWLQSAEAHDMDEDDADRRLDEFLCISNDGKFGITISCDGAWQKRKTGKNGGDSHTGHNFAVGGYSKKIVGLQCYSKHCRLCETAEKKNKVAKDHRCPRNFDIKESAKSMEGIGAVQHCVDISNSQHNIHVARMVTDDDATTRKNCEHSWHDIIEQQHPGTKGPGGKIPSRKKRKLNWPQCANGTLKPENPGLMPIEYNCPKVHCGDPTHRARAFGNQVYKCKSESESKKKGDDGLLGCECEKLKRAFGHYVKKNLHLDLDEFCRQAPCVLYHMFNDHTLCNIEWCTKLQADAEPDPEKKKKIDDPKKYRQTNIQKGHWTVLPAEQLDGEMYLRLSPLGVVPQRDRRPRTPSNPIKSQNNCAQLPKHSNTKQASIPKKSQPDPCGLAGPWPS